MEGGTLLVLATNAIAKSIISPLEMDGGFTGSPLVW
jgi:hypothetical protein